MTIDEAIKDLRIQAERYDGGGGRAKKLVSENRQIAEWLEELKHYKSTFTYTEEVVKEISSQLYEKAIYDFIEKAKEEMDSIYDWNDNDRYEIGLRNGYKYCIKIAKNLKDGGKDENNS